MWHEIVNDTAGDEQLIVLFSVAYPYDVLEEVKVIADSVGSAEVVIPWAGRNHLNPRCDNTPQVVKSAWQWHTRVFSKTKPRPSNPTMKNPSTSKQAANGIIWVRRLQVNCNFHKLSPSIILGGVSSRDEGLPAVIIYQTPQLSQQGLRLFDHCLVVGLLIGLEGVCAISNGFLRLTKVAVVV